MCSCGGNRYEVIDGELYVTPFPGHAHRRKSDTTPLSHRARELARVAHAGHVRKAGDVPYFSHLEAVAELVAEHGHGDEVQIAAAYLHDLIEDRPIFEERLRTEMPLDVVAIVEVLTEPKLDAAGRRRTKQKRFRDYVTQLQADTDAARAAIPVSCADKVHNLRSLVGSEAQEENLLLKLRTRPGEHAAQLAILRPIYEPYAAASLLRAFDEAVAALEAKIERWLPGRAVMIAAEAHLGRFDRAGAPYIEHPLRLMLRAESSDAKVTAVLHDVVEDSPWTLAALEREGFGARVIAALDCLTRRESEGYEERIERIATDPLARCVKLLDLEDSADLGRIAAPTERDRARVAKYQRALMRLRET